MFGFSSSAKIINKLLNFGLKVYNEWKRKRAAKKAQKEYDKIADNPGAAARRMFDRDNE